MRRVLKRSFKMVDAISNQTGKIFSLLFFPGWVLILFSVVMRYFFNNPVVWAGEYAKLIFALYYIIGGAYCLLHDSHIRVDVIYNLFSLKIKKFVELLIVFPVLFAFIFPFIWHGWFFARDSFRIMEVSPPPVQIIMFPIKFAIPIAGVLFLLQALADLYRFWVSKDSGEEI